jgi:MFS family permease
VLERPALDLRRSAAGFWIVAVAFTVVMALGTAPSPLYPLYQQAYGFSSATVTIVFAAYAVGVLGSLFLVGHLSDQLGRRRMLLAALITAAVSAVVFTVWPVLPGLLLARLLSGVAVGMITSTGVAALAELDAAGRPGRGGRRAAVVGTAANLGGLGFGPFLAGLLADLAPWPLHLPYVVHLVGLLAVTALLALVPETVRRPDPRPPYRPQRAAVPPELRRRFAAAALAAIVAFALFGLFAALGSAFIGGTLGSASHTLGGLSTTATFGTAALVQALVRDPAGRWAGLLGIAAVPLGLAVVVAAAWWPSLPLFLAGEVAVGAGAGLMFAGAVRVVAAAAAPENRAEALAGLFLAAYLGLTLPVLGLGVATRYAALPVVFTVYAALAVVVAVPAGRALRRARP